MEWYGISYYGPSNPVQDFMKPDYVEPTTPRNLFDVYAERGNQGRFLELVREIDIYIGQADGYAYKSYDRLLRSRQKGNFKPVGPRKMYRLPATESMMYGWTLEDPAIADKTWHKRTIKYCIPSYLKLW